MTYDTFASTCSVLFSTNGCLPPGRQAMEPEDMVVATYATPCEMHNCSPAIQEGIAVLSQIFITEFALPHINAFAHHAEACRFL